MFNFDFSQLFTIQNIIIGLVGSFVGLLVGAMPGLGTAIAIVLLLPFSYGMKALTTILLLLCAYQGAEYGGSISSITLGIPGTPSAAATVLDGYTMAKNGEPGKAIHYSLFASTIGGIIGAFALAFLTKPLADFSLRFNAPDFCMLGLIALFGIVTISGKDVFKGLISVCIGLMLCSVGTDELTGASRFTMGVTGLVDGIYTVSIAIGVFAVPEMIGIISDTLHKKYVSNAKELKSSLTLKERARVIPHIASGSLIGISIGIFPGIGGGVATWLAYLFSQKTSKHPETFGTGEAQGIAAPEAANNACVSGALIPELALGIPGSPAMAIFAAAFTIHGIKVGPNLFSTDPQLLNGIYWAFFLAVIFMYILGRLLTPFFARVLSVRGSALVPIIMTFILIGVYAGKKSFVFVWVALIIGVICYFLKRLSYPLAPIMIGFVIGPTVEINYRRALELSRGDYSIFVRSGCSKVIFAMLIIVILLPLIKKLFSKLFGSRKSAFVGMTDDSDEV